MLSTHVPRPEGRVKGSFQGLSTGRRDAREGAGPLFSPDSRTGGGGSTNGCAVAPAQRFPHGGEASSRRGARQVSRFGLTWAEASDLGRNAHNLRSTVRDRQPIRLSRWTTCTSRANDGGRLERWSWRLVRPSGPWSAGPDSGFSRRPTLPDRRGGCPRGRPLGQELSGLRARPGPGARPASTPGRSVARRGRPRMPADLGRRASPTRIPECGDAA
jgi:hypothetical protein